MINATPSSSSESRLAELIAAVKAGCLQESGWLELRTLIDDLSFQRVTRIDEADDAPISGEATFCGVSYKFRRISPASIWQNWCPPDTCFELHPIDTGSGLVMRALGRFRKLTALQSNASPMNGTEPLEVRWTSLGAVGLNESRELRHRFAEFLDRLASGTATAAHWDAFVVNHYTDELVENARRECAKLLLDRGANQSCSDSERQELLQWVRRLQDSERPTGLV